MKTITILVAGALVLGGCSSPLVEPQLPTFQKKVTNAEHWQLMANHNVTRVVEGMKNVPELDPRMHVLAGDGTPHADPGRPALLHPCAVHGHAVFHLLQEDDGRGYS